jgi:hypothetical protein
MTLPVGHGVLHAREGAGPPAALADDDVLVADAFDPDIRDAVALYRH